MSILPGRKGDGWMYLAWVLTKSLLKAAWARTSQREGRNRRVGKTTFTHFAFDCSLVIIVEKLHGLVGWGSIKERMVEIVRVGVIIKPFNDNLAMGLCAYQDAKLLLNRTSSPSKDLWTHDWNLTLLAEGCKFMFSRGCVSALDVPPFLRFRLVVSSIPHWCGGFADDA